MKLRFAALAGIVWFAALLAAMEYWRNGHVTWLAAQTVLVACAVVLLASRLKPARWAARVRPGSTLFAPAMFVLLTSHFLHAIGEETLRALRAWRLASGGARSLRGRMASWRSLAHAFASILKRSLTRAERVYSALAISGVAR
jgi:hypothetical protein